MISTDFAPNERTQDALLSLRLLFTPWAWQKGSAGAKVKRRLKTLFFQTGPEIFLFLTGRCGLYYTLKYLKLPKNSEVLVQAFTCEAVILPILANKLKPRYIDMSADDFSMDISDLEKKTTEDSKVLILQHTYGITPINRKEILTFAKKKKLYVIEDVAHGFDQKLFQKSIKSTIILSFGRSKSFSSVFGGAVVTTDEKLSKYLNKLDKLIPAPSYPFLINLALYKPISAFIRATYDIFVGKIIHAVLKSLNVIIPEITKKEKDGNYDMYLSKSYPNIAARLLLEQLRTFNDVSDTRQKISEFYYDTLGGPGVLAKTSVIRYPYLLDNRDSIINLLRKKNIYLGTWYDQVVGPRELELKRVKYTTGSCPVAESICERIINLPTNIPLIQAKNIVTELQKV